MERAWCVRIHPEFAALRTLFARSLVVVAATLVVAALAMPVPARAQADDDLPGRVGRIADFAGQLFLAPQDRATEWSPVGVNYPVTSGDNLWVSGDGRAEVDYGGGQFRLAGDTNLHVSRLDDRQLVLFIAQGRLIVRVRVLDAGDAAIVDTPNTQVTLTRPGLYRIDVAPDRQTTTVAVREGEALVALAAGAQQALPGQTATVTGPDPAQAMFLAGSGIDGFDAWSADRDRRYERGGSAAYVSRQMVGVAELDEYGYWENTPTYGAVWYPTAVAPDWAPYRYGYWTTAGGWGLTWVDAAPWGYAPSHYGRWVRVGSRWGWCPGAYVARPYWAPALVGWVGGAGWGLSVAGGNPVYGWVPLGWGDAYQPWWRRCSNNCWTHYNRPYAVNVHARPAGPPARYSNAAVAGALTAVAAPTLGSRRPVSQNMVPLPSTFARSAPILASAPAVAPSPTQVPAVRPGERGTPPPASSFPSRTWPGRDGRPRGERTVVPSTGGAPSSVPGVAAPSVPSSPPRSAASPPAAAPVSSPGPSAASAPAPAPVPSMAPPHARPGAPAALPRTVTAPPPAAGRVAPPPGIAAPEPRSGAPAASVPQGGGTVVAVPPARSGPAPGAVPATPGATGAGVPQAPSAPQTPSGPQGRRGGAPAGAPAAGTAAPAAGSPSGGVPVPSPRAGHGPPSSTGSGAIGVPLPPQRPGAGSPAATGSAAPGVPMPPQRQGHAPPPTSRAAPPQSPVAPLSVVPGGRGGGAPAASPAPAPQAPAAAPAPATQQERPQGRPSGAGAGGSTPEGGRDPAGNPARK